MNNFTTIAKKMTASGNRITEGKEKLTTQQLLSISDTITITDFSCGYSNERNEDYIICTCAEAPDKFFFAGQILSEIILEWIKIIGLGDPDTAAAQLRQSDGVKFHVESRRGRKGNTYVAWTPID